MEDKKLIIGINEKPKKWYQWLLYSLQHLLSMWVANSLIAILVFSAYGVNMVPAALISAGAGTLLYLLLTKMRSPVFLGSSAALMPVMSTCLALGSTEHGNYIALIIGLAIVGLVYVVVGLCIKKIGTAWLTKLLPPVIVGPIIMLIGLGLASFATDWSMHNGGTTYNIASLIVALITMLVICFISVYGNKTIKTLPFLIGLLAGYVVSCIFTGIGMAANIPELQLVDFSVFSNIQWLPDFAFLKAAEGVEANGFEWGQMVNILLVAIPVSFVAICEHIGDHLNLSNITGRNLLEDPGLGNTLMGDGLATALGGGISGLGNTTYGENVAVIGVTKVGSSYVLIPTTLMAIVLGFFGPLMTFISSIPYAVFGGAALILYGFIAMSGAKTLQKVDLSKTKNTLIVSVILIAGVGGLTLNFMLGSVEFTFTSTALAMILGIILNVIIREPKKEVRKE